MPEHRGIWCSSNEAIPIFVESRSNIGQDEGQINFGASPDDAMLMGRFVSGHDFSRAERASGAMGL
jgi:hypothetical protein